jgi:hypothetical protein
VLVAPALGDVKGRATVFVHQDRGQFNDFPIAHLTQAKPVRGIKFR